MARAVVFVDDAMRGDLPEVCVKTGERATRRVRFSGEVGGGNPLRFLLVFFLGPLGWALLLLGFNGETFQVLLPVSDSAVALWADRRRDRRIAVVGAIAAIGLCLLLARWYGDLGRAPLVMIGAALVVLFVTHWRYDGSGVDLSLDGSRRWVTISGAHPAFVAAVQERDRLPR